MLAKELHFPPESDHQGDAFREAYQEGLEKLVQQELEKAERERTKSFQGFYEALEKYRRQLVEMLGWPLTQRRGKCPPERVTVTPVRNVQGIQIERVQLEVLPGLPFYGILFRKGEERRPLVISQHGGGGTPELCSGLLERGTVNYNHMTQRVLRYGVHVFAPQLFMWDPAQFQSRCEAGDATCLSRRRLDQGLKLLGGSMLALELYCLMSVLDYFEDQEYVDPQRIGMVGLSYGGLYTQYLAALDTRVQAALSSCYFNRDHYRLGSDYTMYREAFQLMNSEIAMLVYPRRLYLQIGEGDPLLPAEGGRAEYSRLKRYAQRTQGDWLHFTVFPGEHEFWEEDGPLSQLMEDLGARP